MKLKQQDLDGFLAWIIEAQKLVPTTKPAEHMIETLIDLQKSLRELQRLKAHNVHLELTADKA